jgi:hypothetical protein
VPRTRGFDRCRCAIFVGLIVLSASASLGWGAARRAGGCTTATVSPAYQREVRSALLSGRDVWGEQLLQRTNGPTYEGAKGYLPGDLFYAVGANGRPLTASGAYYLAFADPPGAIPSGYALHVADGSEIVERRVSGTRLLIFVGANGTERFGSCLRRLGPPQLAEGWLPVLETSYVDAGGVAYRQESFVGRDGGKFTSFLHLAVDARKSRAGAEVRFDSASGTGTTRIPAGSRLDVYAAWSGRRGLRYLSAAAYDAARGGVVGGWRKALGPSVPFVVPEPRVVDAERALLVQELSMGWRYSVGNTYEELSFAESLDAAEVMAEYGFDGAAESIVDFALGRLPERYLSRRAGEVLAAAGYDYLLGGPRALSPQESALLQEVLRRLAGAIERPGKEGLVGPEAISTDVATKIYGAHTQTAVWAGLLEMGRAWARTGQTALAARCRFLAERLAAALRKALTESERRLPDGSLFVPLALLDRTHPFGRLTATRDGSYWNLLMPYALASGFFRPHSTEAAGILRYLRLHGSRLLGLVRGADEKLYGRNRYPATGVDEVYGLAVSRFLADQDQPGQLDLSLYGMLAGSMAPGTFVSGEGASIAPLRGQRERTMVMPPNSGANAAFLETLRLLLVHEVDGGLELAFSAPRSWLADGKTIDVRGAATTFGKVSYSIRRRGIRIEAVLDVPRVPRLRLRLRVPCPERLGSVRIGGRSIPFDGRTETIDLSGRHGRFALEAVLRLGSRC